MEFYFVLHKLFNGERGTYATTCGFEEQQKDGWYYLPDGHDDGIGPFTSREDAEDAAKESGWKPKVIRDCSYGGKCLYDTHGRIGCPECI